MGQVWEQGGCSMENVRDMAFVWTESGLCVGDI